MTDIISTCAYPELNQLIQNKRIENVQHLSIIIVL